MTFFAVVNTERVTLATDRAIVPAAEVEALSDAVGAARRLSELHESVEERVRAAEREGYEAGRREGVADGEAAAAETLAERLLVIERDAEREREALRARAVDHALGIVRRIAATLGEGQTLAALALEAARELLPCGGIVVQVHPERLEEVRSRLAARHRAASGDVAEATLLVEAEESLDPGQCRLRSSNGTVVLAGLETQLRSIERHARDALATSVPSP